MNNSPVLTSGNGASICIEELEAQQDQQRGFPILKLEKQLLIERIMVGDCSAIFLEKAFTSAFLMQPFDLPLGEIIYLDAEGFRLFHQILHIRHVSGWSETEYIQLNNDIQSILRNRRS